MLSSTRRALLLRFFCVALCTCVVSVGPARIAAQDRSPSEIYQELFARVQVERVFADSKTFADAVPVASPETILSKYRAERSKPGFDLKAFVAANFISPVPPEDPPESRASLEVEARIDQLWGVLERQPAPAVKGSSLLVLPHRYVVPGGRFTEIYYWDSYFTMLGLERSGRHDLVREMVANFAWLIEQYGHIPNGNRTYYSSRSQPPFFAFMVQLLAARDGEPVYVEYLAPLRREYAFWMEGAETLAVGAAHRRVVRLDDGSILNRYWDDRDTPRDEAYREDVETARGSQRPAAEVYRDLRAAAESGWDFSSRWLTDGKTLATIRTSDLIPPDLNSLLYNLELTIARGCKDAGDSACTSDMTRRAAARRASMTRYLWNQAVGAFTDYAFRAAQKTSAVTAATLYPLFVKSSTTAQARSVARVVRARLLKAGGIAPTEVQSGEQWDAPNGWAPLQWIAVRGLKNFGQGALASLIAQRWVKTNTQLYRRTGQLVEKYDLQSVTEGSGGEYRTQAGFGWTNGVLKELLNYRSVGQVGVQAD